MPLNSTQITDMQGDLVIGSDESVFTNAELQQLFTRADEDYNLAVYYAWRQILAGSAKWVDYQVAQTKVSKSQAFAQIKEMLTLWANESRNNANQVRILGIAPVPTIWKPEPTDERVGRRSARYPYYYPRWR